MKRRVSTTWRFNCSRRGLFRRFAFRNRQTKKGQQAMGYLLYLAGLAVIFYVACQMIWDGWAEVASHMPEMPNLK